MKMKIVFFGSSKHVIPVIKVLKDKFDLVLVITTEQNSSDAVPFYCHNNKIPYVSISAFSNQALDSQLSALNCEVAVLAYFGLMIPQGILKIFSKGIINIHPSLLPKYRGPTPVQSAILKGEKATGVSIIRLDDKVDHGPILTQKVEEILKDDTADTLYARLFKIGADLIEENLGKYLDGKTRLKEQDHSRATLTIALSKKDGLFDTDTSPSPEVLNRMVRAYYPWPGVFFKAKLNEEKRIIKLLPQKEIQVEGKKPMNYKDFINGYKMGKEILKKLKLIS